MVFSSLIFLYIYLPACMILYFAAPTIKVKNIVLTIASLIFYAWGEPVWVALLVISALTDYVIGMLIAKYRGTWKAKAALICSLVINLGLLCVFKYLNFIFYNFGLIGLSLPELNFVMPIGISFYTFQTLSYSIDVYRDKVEVQRSFPDFLLFVSLFTQLVAGPILRYSEIAKQLADRKVTLEGFFMGITRFACGLGKKVLIANYAGNVATNLLGGNLSILPVSEAWLGILMFAFQIYFDFSGYSDMAIGLGRMFGFWYGENFNLPYTSKSVTEFWRRWHISLGAFFRDYLYIPLGGNRHMQIRNLFVVWFLTGLWHGAGWNFILWGLYFFVFLVIEKFLLKDTLGRVPRFVSWFYAFLIVLFGWVFFYFTDMTRCFEMFGAMFGAHGNAFLGEFSLIKLTNNIPLIVIAALGSSPLARYLSKRILSPEESGIKSKRLANAVTGSSALIFVAAMLFLCTISLVGSSFNPFLYFRF